MAKKLQLRGGTTSEHSSFTGAVRECTVDTTKDTLVVHDGSTAGGHVLAKDDEVLKLAGGTMTGHITGGDNIYLKLGASNDLQIVHDGANSYITDAGTGGLKVQGSTFIHLTSASGAQYFTADEGGAARIYYNGSGKLESTNTGINVTGKVVCDTLGLNDNEKIELGTHGDLEIYHDGSHSYIDDTGTGRLYIRGNDSIKLLKYTGENMATFWADAGCEFYYDNSKKLETTSSGCSITGELNVSTKIKPTSIELDDNQKLLCGNSSDLQIYHDGSDSVILDTGTGNLSLKTDGNFYVLNEAGTKVMIRADVNASVRLYNDGSQKLNTENGGVGITGDLTASGNLISNSDERVKEDIRVIPNALSKIEEIRGVTFTRNDLEDTEARHTGVIAQEVEKVLPEVVGENEEGIKNVAYGNMVGLLIEGMKEQQEIIRSLASRITDLEEG